MFYLKNPGKLFAIIGIVGTLGGAALAAHAQATATPVPPPPPVSDKFAAHKQREIARIANHIQILQTLQSCVQSANDRAGVKSCNQDAHSALAALKYPH
jgi:hypothetical protein